MARGITESDVHIAADALVAGGERPTVERVRAHLGTGSPNTVVRWLDTWWQGLGARLARHDQVRVATANVPDAVAALAGQWWTLAFDHARSHADDALSGERAALLEARDALERNRLHMEGELAEYRGDAEAARQAERFAVARATELERLVEQLHRQVGELAQQRDASATRTVELSRAYEAVQIQLQQLQEVARTEREALTQHVRATEDRAHAEVDRARQDAKDTRQQLAVLRRETDASAHKQTVALEHAASVAADLRQQLAAQQARADALDAQLLHLRDLPATLEAVWRKHEKEAKPLDATRTVRVRKRRSQVEKSLRINELHDPK